MYQSNAILLPKILYFMTRFLILLHQYSLLFSRLYISHPIKRLEYTLQDKFSVIMSPISNRSNEKVNATKTQVSVNRLYLLKNSLHSNLKTIKKTSPKEMIKFIIPYERYYKHKQLLYDLKSRST